MIVNRPSTHRRTALVAAGLLAAAVVALGITRVATSADTAKTKQARLWKWAARVPGVRTGDVPLAATAARAAGLDPATVRSVVASGAGRGEARLVSASSHAGGVCFAVTTLGEASSFSCRRPGAQEAMLIRVVYGGSSFDSVDHVTVVGVGRGDIGSVSVTTTDGTARTLALNQWRGFGYAAVDPSSLPTALSAYGRNGLLLQRVNLSSFAAPE